jgi:hypothetical protein
MANLRASRWAGIFAAAAALFGAPEARAVDGGVEDTGNAYGNVAAIFRQRADGSWAQSCTGTYVGDGLVLTAAHCTSFWESLGAPVAVSFHPDISAIAGLVDPAQLEPYLIYAHGTVTHPWYTYFVPISDVYDIGLVLIDAGEAAEAGVAPATLPEPGLLDSLRRARQLHGGQDRTPFTVAGYGYALEFAPPTFVDPDARMVARVDYLSLDKGWLVLTQNPASAPYAGTCFGDSGGPVFLGAPALGGDDGGGEVEAALGEGGEDAPLVGVTSWGDAMCVGIGFYQRVDLPGVLAFIDAHRGSEGGGEGGGAPTSAGRKK